MRNVTTFHMLLLIIVYVIDRKHRYKTKETLQAQPDAVRDAIPTKGVHPLLPYMLVAVPLYMLMTNNAALLEHVLVMYVGYLSVRSVQIVLNKETRPPIEYTAPFMVMSMLMLMYKGMIPRTQLSLAYMYMAAYSVVALLAFPKKTTSSSVMDDFILSHLMFYTFK